MVEGSFAHQLWLLNLPWDFSFDLKGGHRRISPFRNVSSTFRPCSSLSLFWIALPGIPDHPTNVRLMVTGCDHITVSFDEPLRSQGAMVVKYKSKTTDWSSPSFADLCSLVEWSTDEQFTNSSSDIIKNCFLREYVIRNLPIGEKCFVRVSAGNIKGFGPAALASPAYCVPSSRSRESFRRERHHERFLV